MKPSVEPIKGNSITLFLVADIPDDVDPSRVVPPGADRPTPTADIAQREVRLSDLTRYGNLRLVAFNIKGGLSGCGGEGLPVVIDMVKEPKEKELS